MRKVMGHCVVVSGWILAVLVAPTVSADDLAALPAWNGWRGSSRHGEAAGPKWPDRLSGGALEEVWHADLGPSYSGPLLTQDRVYVTATEEQKFEAVIAFDVVSGEELWKTRWEGAMTVPFFAQSNGSWIRSTPTLDGERLYVAGMRDVLVCLDSKSGKELWRVDFVEKLSTPLPAFGFVCSPLVHGDSVYVQAGASFVKVRKEDGAIVWRTLKDDGGMNGSAFSSPTVATIGGKEQVLVQTRTRLAGIDIESGEVLWSHEIPAFRGMNIVTPTVSGDAVFTSAYGGGSVCLRIERSNDDPGFSVREAWKDPAQGYMSTPVLVDGHLFLHLRNQRMACFELATGAKRWTTTQRFGRYMSLVYQGDRILALDEGGELLLLRADPERFEQLDSATVSTSPTWAHLAMRGELLAIRSLDRVMFYRWQEPPASAFSGGVDSKRSSRP